MRSGLLRAGALLTLATWGQAAMADAPSAERARAILLGAVTSNLEGTAIARVVETIDAGSLQEELTWVVRGNVPSGDWRWDRRRAGSTDRIERRAAGDWIYLQRIAGGWSGQVQPWSDDSRLHNPFSVMQGYWFPINRERLDTSLRERAILNAQVGPNSIEVLLAAASGIPDALSKGGAAYGHLGYHLVFRRALGDWHLSEMSFVESERLPKPDLAAKTSIEQNPVAFIDGWRLDLHGETYGRSERRTWSEFIRIGSLVMPLRCEVQMARATARSYVDASRIVELSLNEAEQLIRFAPPSSWTGHGRLTNTTTGQVQMFTSGAPSTPDELVRDASILLADGHGNVNERFPLSTAWPIVTLLCVILGCVIFAWRRVARRPS